MKSNRRINISKISKIFELNTELKSFQYFAGFVK